MITNDLRRYDDLLLTMDSRNLKKIARLWGGRANMPKDECIRHIRQALADPRAIDALLARLQPFERAALGLMKLFGGKQDLHSLCKAVRATSVVAEKANSYGHDSLANDLMERGIVLTASGYQYYSFSYSSVPVVADDRILARVQSLEHTPLSLKLDMPPTASTARRPQSLVLDVIAMVRAVNDIGGIGLTKAGEPRVNDSRKFARKMGWDGQAQYDGLAIPEPARVFLQALVSGGLLIEDGDRLVGATGLEQIGARPVGTLVQSLTCGILGVSDWLEYDAGRQDYWIKQHAGTGRFILLATLCCLPEAKAWFRFDDFERALFDRVGAHFSVESLKTEPRWARTPAEQQAAQEEWRLGLRANWENHDVRWLQAAFRTWLYAFGLLELSLAGDKVERFRLTEAGRVALGYEAAAEASPSTAGAEQTPSWIVQPNFDVVVYLESASTQQVAFLEQFAERVNLAQHMAQYRLTRASVYAGLERGMDVDRLIAGMAAGSRIELPGNVIAEIRSWAALRERIVVRRQVDLLEFPDAAARQRALDTGMQGRAVGERFLLITGDPVKNGVDKLAPQVIDYANPSAPKCLSVSEEGLITLAATRRDLYTPGYLDLWAERKSDTTWQLTREKVADAIRRGRTLRELLTLLQDRLTGTLPPLLKVALRSWSGETIAAGLSEVVILQCTQTETLDALLASKALKPYLLGRVGSDTVLVKSGSILKVREILDWAGLQTSTQIIKQRY